MSALAPIPRPWNYHSHVAPCETCEGQGFYWNGLGNGGNDPDSWDIECPDCEAVGHFACKVCGFDQVIAGYDCYACETVDALTSADLAKFDPAAFSKAVAAATERARAGAA